MSASRTWTESQLKKLKRLVMSQKHTYPEIAEMLGRSRSECQQRAEYMGLRNPVYIRRRTKHKHLRKHVLLYYKNHSAKETQKHFRLTPSEFKSCLTIAYKNPEWAHIRKDKRRHDSWSLDEVRTLLQYSGLKPRKWISKKLNRGGVHSVKEELSRLKLRSKHLNGMPKDWVSILFGSEFSEETIRTKAGPTGLDKTFCFRIIPWVQLERLIRNKSINPDIKASIRALSRFQKWVFGTKNAESIIAAIGDNIYE